MGSVIAHRICSNVYFSQLTAGQIARGGGYSVRQLCTGCISCSPSEKCHLAAAQHVHAYSNWNWMYSVCHSVWLGVWVPWYPLYRIYICSKGRVTGPWPALVLLRLQSSVSHIFCTAGLTGTSAILASNSLRVTLLEMKGIK